MNKNLIISIILFSLNHQCIAYNNDFRQPYTPLYELGTPATSRDDSPNTFLHPKVDNRIPTELERFRKQPIPNKTYQSQCQFGTCMPSGKPTERLDLK